MGQGDVLVAEKRGKRGREGDGPFSLRIILRFVNFLRRHGRKKKPAKEEEKKRRRRENILYAVRGKIEKASTLCQEGSPRRHSAEGKGRKKKGERGPPLSPPHKAGSGALCRRFLLSGYYGRKRSTSFVGGRKRREEIHRSFAATFTEGSKSSNRRSTYHSLTSILGDAVTS